MTTPGTSPMTAEEHLLLNEIIEKQFGLSFSAAKRDFLESRLRPRLQALRLKRFIDYYLLLQYDLNGEVEHLARLVTNNETYFFRETYQFEGLFSEGLEELRSTSRDSVVRVLCAGCSSGEEPYTLNFFAHDHGIGASWEIDAFDIDVERLATAKEGVYGGGSLRSLSEEQREKYFSPVEGDRLKVKPSYRNNVDFSFGNILDADTYRRPYRYDALFCRNVLIYFSDPGFHQAILNFGEVLRPGGLLFLGHSESLIGRSTSFETMRLQRCIAYKRKAE